MEIWFVSVCIILYSQSTIYFHIPRELHYVAEEKMNRTEEMETYRTANNRQESHCTAEEKMKWNITEVMEHTEQ